MDIFYKYRGNLLTGGICVKEYLDLKFYDGRPNEYRVFYANHEILCIAVFCIIREGTRYARIADSKENIQINR